MTAGDGSGGVDVAARHSDLAAKRQYIKDYTAIFQDLIDQTKRRTEEDIHLRRWRALGERIRSVNPEYYSKMVDKMERWVTAAEKASACLKRLC